MNETEKTIAAKLLAQILEAKGLQQIEEIRKYAEFINAVNVRTGFDGTL